MTRFIVRSIQELETLIAVADVEYARRTKEAGSEKVVDDDVPMAEPKPASPSPAEFFHDASDEPAVGTYQTAISAVVANEVSVPVFSAPRPTGLTSPPARAAPIINENSAPMPVKLERPHEFALGDAVYTKFSVADDCNQFFHGKIVELLPDGGYRVQYDDGDVFSVERQFLFTEDQVRSPSCPSWRQFA